MKPFVFLIKPRNRTWRSQHFNRSLNYIETKKMTTETKQIEVPDFEATSDGKRIYTPKQWLERFRQYTKIKHKIDITELLRGAEMTQNGWTGKETDTRRLYMGHRPRSTVSNDTGRIQNRTRQYRGERPNQTIERILSTETEFIS